jgi:hypothetical protein
MQAPECPAYAWLYLISTRVLLDAGAPGTIVYALVHLTVAELFPVHLRIVRLRIKRSDDSACWRMCCSEHTLYT